MCEDRGVDNMIINDELWNPVYTLVAVGICLTLALRMLCAILPIEGLGEALFAVFAGVTAVFMFFIIVIGAAAYISVVKEDVEVKE